MRSLKLIVMGLFGPNPEYIIPSPWDVGVKAKNWAASKKRDFVAYTVEVKKAQNDFQNAIQKAGIDEISGMTTQEVLQTFTNRQKIWARDALLGQPPACPCEPQNEAAASPPAP